MDAFKTSSQHRLEYFDVLISTWHNYVGTHCTDFNTFCPLEQPLLVERTLGGP